jgi:mannose-6-phosphate isomerase
MKLYPLQFEPILKRIWGGEKAKTILHKPIDSTITGDWGCQL